MLTFSDLELSKNMVAAAEAESEVSGTEYQKPSPNGGRPKVAHGEPVSNSKRRLEV